MFLGDVREFESKHEAFLLAPAFGRLDGADQLHGGRNDGQGGDFQVAELDGLTDSGAGSPAGSAAQEQLAVGSTTRDGESTIGCSEVAVGGAALFDHRPVQSNQTSAIVIALA